MRNIFKNLLDVKSNLSLCAINLISEEEISIDLNGIRLKAEPSLNPSNIVLENDFTNIEPIESPLLQCVLSGYIDKLISISKFEGNNFVNKSYTLEEINNMNFNKIKEINFNFKTA